MRTKCIVARRQGLGGVERLVTDFADVGHPHQGRRVAAFLRPEVGGFRRNHRARAGGARRGKEGAQGLVGGAEETVHAASLVPHPAVNGRTAAPSRQSVEIL